MKIGIPKEIKNGEYRVSIIPMGVEILTSRGHEVFIETNAGLTSGITDNDYKEVGAKIVDNIQSVYELSEMILKVKEILPAEYDLMKEDQIIFTYLHTANRPEETQALLRKKVIAFAYEDIMDDDGKFPLLQPMSEIAGAVGSLMGIYHMLTTKGGNGILVGGAPGVEPAKVIVLGAGSVGVVAARYALNLGADVTILDINIEKMQQVKDNVLPNVKTLYSCKQNIIRILKDTDMVINAVKWIPGLTLISRDMLKYMKKDSLIVDIDCEPNGAIETCRYSTHDNPIYEVDGIRHLCVPNLPSAVANTSSAALSNATIPYVFEIANKGWYKAANDNESLKRGLDFIKGHLTFRDTAIAQNIQYEKVEDVLEEYKNIY